MELRETRRQSAQSSRRRGCRVKRLHRRSGPNSNTACCRHAVAGIAPLEPLAAACRARLSRGRGGCSLLGSVRDERPVTPLAGTRRSYRGDEEAPRFSRPCSNTARCRHAEDEEAADTSRQPRYADTSYRRRDQPSAANTDGCFSGSRPQPLKTCSHGVHSRARLMSCTPHVVHASGAAVSHVQPGLACDTSTPLTRVSGQYGQYGLACDTSLGHEHAGTRAWLATRARRLVPAKHTVWSPPPRAAPAPPRPRAASGVLRVQPASRMRRARRI